MVLAGILLFVLFFFMRVVHILRIYRARKILVFLSRMCVYGMRPGGRKRARLAWGESGGSVWCCRAVFAGVRCAEAFFVLTKETCAEAFFVLTKRDKEREVLKLS